MKRLYIKIIQWMLNHSYYTPEILLLLFDKIAWSSKELLEDAIIGIKPKVLLHLSRKKLMWVFWSSIKETPALKKYYKDNNFNTDEIHNISDFYKIPQTTKLNYISRYSLEDRCRRGKLPKIGIIFKSAGVAGERTYWSQSISEEKSFSVFVPFGLEYLFKYSKKDYHILNCWAFGTWPTAIDFTKAAQECGRMINIGPNINETIETIIKLRNIHEYLISGYPPYLRNLILEGKSKGLNWSDYKIDILTGGESFVEEWRDLLQKELGGNSIIISAYGSTDKGLGEGIETPLTIVIRNILRIFQLSITSINDANQCVENIFKKQNIIGIPNKSEIIKFYQNYFKQDLNSDLRIPMLFQTDPLTYYHETVNKNESINNKNEIATTALKPYASQPVIRYNIEDESGWITYDELLNGLYKLGIDPLELIKYIPHGSIKTLPYPFYYVYGRSSGMISIDGVNIFPEEVGRMIENIKIGNLLNSFKLEVTKDYKICIYLELKQDVNIKLDNIYSDDIRNSLINLSPGYRVLVNEKLPSSELKIILNSFGEGVFSKSPSVNPYIVKYQYVGSKILGHH